MIDPSQVALVLVTMGEQERLWSKIAVGEPDECWPYQGATNDRGYGWFKTRLFPSKLAHRIIDHITNGPIPDGICVLHRCDNPPCCNPDHLWRGTRIDNNRDMREKGRGCDPPRNNLRGERHPLAKLTKEAVLEIRTRRAAGEGVTALAHDFGVSHSLVSTILSGKKWAWL